MRDLELLKALYRLEVEEGEEEDTSSPPSQPTPPPSIPEASSLLDHDESSLRADLHTRKSLLTDLSSQRQSGDIDLDLITTIIDLTEKKEIRQKQLKETHMKIEKQREEIDILTLTHEEMDGQRTDLEGKSRDIRGKIKDIRGMLPNRDEITAKTNEIGSILTLREAIPYLYRLEEKRQAAVHILQSKRKEWKQAESALSSQYEDQLKSLESELNSIEQTTPPTPPTPPTPKSQQIDPQGVILSPKRTFFKTRDKPSSEVDLESLLGNAGPSMERIKEVTQQYRTSAKDSSD